MDNTIQKITKRSCEILFVLDHSSSMQRFAKEVINGFNSFLKAQHAVAQNDATMSFMVFDDEYDVIFTAKPIKQIPALTEFHVGGGTALFDAVGRTISDGMARHSVEGRPKRTLVVLLTDGEDEHSKKYAASTVKPLVERVRACFNWEFIFIGVGINAVSTARDIGILPELVLPVAATTEGVREAYLIISRATQLALQNKEIKLLR